MGYLDNFSTEELALEIANRKNIKLLAWRDDNLAANRRLTIEIVDFLAPLHSKKDCSDCNKVTELISSGYSRCNRCSLEALRKSPEEFSDVRMDFTIDFTLSRQTSFK